MADRPTSSTSEQDQRQEAGPLPSKRGEIGYREDIHGQAQQRAEDPPTDFRPLPPRHPADRDPPPESTPPTHDPVPPASPSPTTAGTGTGNTDNTRDNSSTHKCDKGCLISFFKCGKGPIYLGVRFATLLLLALQLLFLCATIAVWVLIGLHLSQRTSNQAPAASTLSGPSQPQNTSNGTIGIFVHVIFAILLLAQLVFLERRIFCVRAELLMHYHPEGAVSTPSRRASAMPIAPWNRPPLPTYAATLAQSGVGTGDVEDHLIAAPPPPAYGNTRGSTLLLAGVLRESLRAHQRGLHLQRSGTLRSQRSGRDSVPGTRPVSYHTTDEEWEARRDGERMRQLEETLGTLQRSHSRPRRDEIV